MQRWVISFDLDGVLLDDPLADTLFREVIEDLARQIAPRWGWPLERAIEEIRQRLGNRYRQLLRHPATEVAAYNWESHFHAVGQELGAIHPVDLMGRLRAFFADGHPIACFPDAHVTLERLSGSGARLIAVSNGYACFQEPLLAASGLRRYFDVVVTADRARAAKPNPAIFRYAASHVPGDRWIHVGDSLFHDVLGGVRAGVETIWLWRDMPEDLRRLAPKERVRAMEQPALVEALTLRMKREGAEKVPSLPRPDAVIAGLEELEEYLALGDGARITEGRRDDGGPVDVGV